MNFNKITRSIHHWGSIILALPLVIMIGAGVLLMVKKEFTWIQPQSQRGVGVEISANGHFDTMSMSELFAIVRAEKPDSFHQWGDLARVDVKPGRDIVKFVSDDNWEVQIDLVTGEVLQTAYRRSDFIESIHDGSYFAGWTKLWVFLPAGIILFILWLTGLWMFGLPHYKQWKKRQTKKAG